MKVKVIACAKPMVLITVDWLSSNPNSTLLIFFAAIITFLRVSGMQGCKLWRSQVIRGIDNIGICTTGLSEAYRNDRGVMMAAGDAHLFIFATRQANPPPVTRELGLFGNPPGIDHISFAVADVDALYS